MANDDEIQNEVFVHDRRKRDRRQNSSECSHESPCTSLIVTENRLSQLAQEFYDFKRDSDRDSDKAEKERAEILKQLVAIADTLSRQKGFIAGVIWLGTALLGVAGTAFGFFKDH